MELIAANARINAKPAEVLTALTTTDGFRHWWTDDAEVGRDIGAPAIFRFGTIEVTFLIDRIDRHGIEMTCVDHKNYPEWLDTHLAFRVTPDGEGAYVDMLHDGFRDKNGCYAQCVERWNHYLTNLRAYCETGRGTPQLRPALSAPTAERRAENSGVAAVEPAVSRQPYI
jgi:uncharacterized protein YndB with AHSA1/START domain